MAYRYLGNKSRLVDVIVAAVADVLPRGGTVADPMCGTATVATALAGAGFTVTAGDELSFPVLHARVRLLLGEVPAFAALGGYDEVQAELNALAPRPGLFHREYSVDGAPRNGCRPRAYFTGSNAGRIDAIRAQIREWAGRGLLTATERDLLLHDLILAVNRVANIAGTYGYYRSSWNRAAREPLRLEPSGPAGAGGDHRVVQGRVEDTVGDLPVDLLYLDPPYTKRQYAGQYHVLETLAVDDDPEPVGEGGLRDWYGQYSAFCSRRMVRDAFRTVLANAAAPTVLLSYSEDALVSPGEMLALLSEFGDVERRELPVARFRSNGGRPGRVTEHLYVLDARRSRRETSERRARAAVTRRPSSAPAAR
ncbi:MAG TPA: DNA adenine methylase [Solirubrobacteraceae bacterium]|nr:DNA adenine methylase [Solirubrobacteraceae bacterium]